VTQKLVERLVYEGFSPALYDNVIPEPPLEKVLEAAAVVREKGFDVLVGLGGGSSMDFTKGVALAAALEEPLEHMFGLNRVPRRGLPTVMIPTTSGSGSEVSPVAIFTLPEGDVKKGIASPHLVPDVALVDPLLTEGLPAGTTAHTGMDALVHAVESFLSGKANPLSQDLALAAAGRIFRHLPEAVADGHNARARYELSLGSLTAGMAFAMSGTAAVHALAYPVGARYHVPHGLANAVLFGAVMDFNARGCPEPFPRLGEALGLETGGLPAPEAAEKVSRAILDLADRIGMKTRLRDLGIPLEALPDMARAAMGETRLLDNNPVPVTVADAEAIYRLSW
jgi:alcohol dehydrogenase class IV